MIHCQQKKQEKENEQNRKREGRENIYKRGKGRVIFIRYESFSFKHSTKIYIMSADFFLLTTHDEYIRAAPDAHLSSSETHLLATLLSEEDQLDYNQLLETNLSQDILHILHQVIFLTIFNTLLFIFQFFF